jgi:uncharacterized protein (DUF1800 family)
MVKPDGLRRMTLDPSIALTRFGLGARPAEIGWVRTDPAGWLEHQITTNGAPQPQITATTAQRLTELRTYQRQQREAKQAGDPKNDQIKMLAKLLRDDAAADFLARFQLGATTDRGFAERWALFWANHFTVSATKGVTASLIGPFEQEAIRPHVFGRFEDMLVASSQHPAMLIYLDQAQSIGPDSFAAERARRNPRARPPGLNENLAREIMELHSVGVEAGYSQADVTEFARAMTGWSTGRLENPEESQGFMFRPGAHEPGSRTIMGKRYADNGEEQARAVMRDLAASPHTAHHLAVKLGRHFVADDPPASLTARLTQAYLKSDGRLDVVAKALVTAPEAWNPTQAKFKTPYEFLVSSWRAADTEPLDIKAVAGPMTEMGQKPFSAPSPKGWAEESGEWCAPDAVVKRMAWSEGFAAQAIGQHDPKELAENALGTRLTPAVATAISRAETRSEGLSILLMSPEFQRR